MIRNRSKIMIALVVALIAAGVFIAVRRNKAGGNGKSEYLNPQVRDMTVSVTTTGVVQPRNRLEIKPSIPGRIESILVQEGTRVKAGDILAWMSSTERAALVDAARSQGRDALAYWEDVYKKTPLVAPIDGEVIVRAVEPGQTVTTADAVLVLADRLIISAQFDETDIGRVKTGQKAAISLDAYPDVAITGTVEHIAYESEVLNNVTIYDVDILPDQVPEMLRSGMSVSVSVVEKKIAGALTLPLNAVTRKDDKAYVSVRGPDGTVIQREVTLGVEDEFGVEIVRGLSADEPVEIKNAVLPSKKSAGTNPFMPWSNREREKEKQEKQQKQEGA